MNIEYIIAPIFFFVSIIFSMVGQGGASAYTPILTLFQIDHNSIPLISLACNVVVTSGATYHFAKAGHTKIKLLLPFILTAAPAAFFSSRISISRESFLIILIVTLLIISIRLLFWKNPESSVRSSLGSFYYVLAPIIGIALGTIAGLIGIGGGVLLMPTILICRFGTTKEAAAAGGLFTLFSSVFGVAGKLTSQTINLKFMIPIIIAVFIGSQIGSYLGARKLSSDKIQKIFAVCLLLLSIKLILNLF